MESVQSDQSEQRRRPYRPPIGITGHPEPRAQATVASFLLHALVILLILAPTIFVSTQILNVTNRGAGGPGPAGGGGGGPTGTGGVLLHEGLPYLVRTPPAPQPKPEATPTKPKE